jgi:hypothetical protein
MVVAERAHQLAPPHFSPRLNVASPGPTTGTSGDTAPMAEPPDPLANSRIAFAALRARMSQEATNENIGHTDSARLSHATANKAGHFSPIATSAHALSRRNVTPNPYPTSQPSTRYRQSTICNSLLRGGITINSGGDDDLGRDGHDRDDDVSGDGHDTFGFGLNGHNPNGHNPNASRDVPIRGAPIVSPQHSDRSMHARTLGASHFDVMKLASEGYHSGMDGVPP